MIITLQTIHIPVYMYGPRIYWEEWAFMKFEQMRNTHTHPLTQTHTHTRHWDASISPWDVYDQRLPVLCLTDGMAHSHRTNYEESWVLDTEYKQGL